MKTTLTLLLSALVFDCAAQRGVDPLRQGFTLNGQPKQAVHDPQPTPEVAAGTNVFRVISNQVYNVVLAQTWETIPPKFCRMKVDSVRRDGVICEFETMDLYSYDYRHKGYALVRNLPDQKKLKTGDVLKPIRAKDIGRTDVYGDTVSVYDYGQIYTPPAPPPPNTTAITAGPLKNNPLADTNLLPKASPP